MPFIGPWGSFYHIPRCGGTTMRYFLRSQYQNKGEFVREIHDYPIPGEDLTRAFCIVRHPAEWLVSYYAYIDAHEWVWPDVPHEIDDLFSYAAGKFWPQWVRTVTQREPGAVGKVYDLYCVPGVTVHKLEELEKICGQWPGLKNVTEIKPLLTLEHWKMICEAERETLIKYGYTDEPTRIVRMR